MSDATTTCKHLRWTSVRPANLSTAIHICGDCGERLSDKHAHAEKVTWDDLNVNMGLEICKTLHISDRWITSMKLEMFPGTPPVLTLERVVMGAEHEALRGVLERYLVTPIGSAPVVGNPAPTE